MSASRSARLVISHSMGWYGLVEAEGQVAVFPLLHWGDMLGYCDVPSIHDSEVGAFCARYVVCRIGFPCNGTTDQYCIA